MISTTPRRNGSSPPVQLGPEDGTATAAEPIVIKSGPGDGNRLPYMLVIGVVLLAMAALVGYYLTSSIEVELSIDGRAEPVETRADTVAEFLADQAVEVTNDDMVEPSLDAELVEGTPVVVRYARSLTVTIDGVENDHTTTELTLGDALAAIDAPVANAALSSPLSQPLPRNGASVEIITPKSITVDDGGRSRSVTTTAKTIQDLLSAENIELSDTDILAPAADTVVTESMTVTVTRIRIENDTRTETIAHDTVERKDGELTVGTRRTAAEGVDGEKEVTYAVTYTNGEITSEEPISTAVTREPVTEVVRVGTKPAPVAPVDPGVSAGGAAAGLNWAALAQCESSGNPKAVNPAGYYGLYQFSLRTWASVGGSGNPVDASVAEQTKRAEILYNKAGAGQWPHCGKYLFG
jgi:uncharacterized protein YabE (DUF348 family)